MQIRAVQEAAFALFVGFGVALIAELLGADAEWVLRFGTGAGLAAWVLLASPAKKQEAKRGFGSSGEVRERQVVLFLYVPNEGSLAGARCEVRRAEKVWDLGDPMCQPVNGGIHPFRGVWRFPAEPADPQPGRYKARMYVQGRGEAAGVFKWKR